MGVPVCLHTKNNLLILEWLSFLHCLRDLPERYLRSAIALPYSKLDPICDYISPSYILLVASRCTPTLIISEGIQGQGSVYVSERDPDGEYGRASDFFNDHDETLTDYESLRKKAMYSRTHWYRIVLDECQEIKVATNAIA